MWIFREEDYGSESESEKQKRMMKISDNKKGDHQSINDKMMVITRPKGGTSYLFMDLEEVKACRDLGFDLEHHHYHHHRHHTTTNCRISSPGDDPRDVKTRLKLWAQAVALASTSISRKGC